MLGLDPRFSGHRFPGLLFAAPGNDASGYAASPRFSSSASGVGRRPRNSL
jgi:hypothetical protein